ncbi:MAG: hypothetical protein ACTSWY_02520 [Promethearchaeota archaeon]
MFQDVRCFVVSPVAGAYGVSGVRCFVVSPVAGAYGVRAFVVSCVLRY